MRSASRGLVTALAIGAAPSLSIAGQDTAIDVARLHFGAVRGQTQIVAYTPPQSVFLERQQRSQTPIRWSADTNREWLEVTPTGGAAPARLSIAIRPEAALRLAGQDSGQVRVTVTSGSGTSHHSIDVTLTMLAERSGPPIGAFDAPADGTVVRRARIPLSGWALDDVAVSAVEICIERSPASGDTPCADRSRTLVGHARVAAGARPDVEAAFPTLPLSHRSSWSYLLDQAALPKGRRGTARLLAMAIDGENQSAVLGAKAMTLLPPEALPTPWRPIVALLGLGAAFFVCHLMVRRRLPEARAPAIGAEPETGGRTGAGERIAIAAALGVSLFFNLSGITRGFTYDELYTASHYVVGARLSDTATNVAILNNHVLYSLAATVCTWILGPAEWVIRLPAVVLGTAAVYAVWRFTRQFAGPTAAVLAAFALACSPFFVEWGRSARGYTALGLMAVLSSHVFLVALRTGSRSAALWHAPATLLPLYVHLYGGWVLAVQYVTYVIVLARRNASYRGLRALWWSFCAIAAGAVVLYLPLIGHMLRSIGVRGRGAFNAAFPFELFHAYAGASSTLMLGWIAVLMGMGVWRFRRRLESCYVVALLAIPLLTIWLFIRPRDLYPRYFAYWTPFFCVLVAVGADALARHISRWTTSGTHRQTVRALLASLVLLPPAAGWARLDLAQVDSAGYRAPLDFPDRERFRVVAVGIDAEMFDYYLGKPVEMFHVPEDADRAMRESRPLAVAYHTVRNSPQHRAVAALLRRRCVADEAGVVTRFYCNAAPAR